MNQPQHRRPRYKRRVINKKRLMLSIVLVILTAELVFAALTSPTFAIRKVEVVGNQTIPTSEILHSLRLPPDANIFRIEKDSVLYEVRRNPAVQEVSLHRKLPRTLVVSISERKPHFVLNSSGTLYEVDSSGMPFRVDKAVKSNLPMISCKVRRRIILGRPIKDSAFDSARKCLLIAQAKKNFGTVKITVDQKRDLCLNVRDDFEVKLGRPEQLARKMDIAEQVIEQSTEFQKRGAYIDVTCPEAPAYKLKE